MLLDAETFYRHDLLLAVPAAEWAPRLHWSAPTHPQDYPLHGPPASFEQHQRSLRTGMALALDVSPAIALVNDCRWVAYCPDPGCSEAQAASRTDRRYFCTTCLNRECGGHWRPVWWPEDQEVERAERMHATRSHVRPDGAAQQCHWWPSNGAGKPHELLADLLRQGRLRQFQLTPAAFGIQAA